MILDTNALSAWAEGLPAIEPALRAGDPGDQSRNPERRRPSGAGWKGSYGKAKPGDAVALGDVDLPLRPA